jgi:hypothetical protein
VLLHLLLIACGKLAIRSTSPQARCGLLESRIKVTKEKRMKKISKNNKYLGSLLG